MILEIFFYSLGLVFLFVTLLAVASWVDDRKRNQRRIDRARRLKRNRKAREKTRNHLRIVR